jgi:hypothetical protein
VIFAILFGVIATGMTFYVFTFAAMFGALGSGRLNPAVSPGVTWSLRDVGVPVAVAAGLLVFVITWWRSGRPVDSEPGFQINNRKSRNKD